MTWTVVPTEESIRAGQATCPDSRRGSATVVMAADIQAAGPVWVGRRFGPSGGPSAWPCSTPRRADVYRRCVRLRVTPTLAATFYALYAGRMAGREYGWTEAGKASAARHGVTEREVIEALYSPQRIEHEIGTLLLAVAGLADTARGVVVLCERIGEVDTFGIRAARLAGAEEIKLWLEGTR